MKSNPEKGQALLVVLVAMGLFLFGALGLALDVSQWFAHQQMAQVAADAAAQAAMLSIFQGVNNATANPDTVFPTNAPFECSQYPNSTPCKYAAMNGFGNDTVTVSFPACVPTPNAACSSSLTPNSVQVTITRSVGNTFIRMIGGAAANPIGATGIAAAITVIAPVPLLITHPSLDHSLSSTGGPTTIRICGGPQRSVQVNSWSILAYDAPKAGNIDLSKGGPTDLLGDCHGTGSDFAVFGGATTDPGAVINGTAGSYLSSQSPIEDPLRDVPAPGDTIKGVSGPPIPTTAGHFDDTLTTGNDGCVYANCREYYPGLYSKIDTSSMKNGWGVIFRPGLYYIQGGGFTIKGTVGGTSQVPPNGDASAMCVGCPADPDTGTGMVVYDTGPVGSTVGNNPTGGFYISTGVKISFIGSTLTATVTDPVTGTLVTVPAAPYYGISFWEDRNADAHTGNGSHSLGQGNGCFNVTGTMYLTNWRSIMNDPAHYQAVDYNGGPCSTTINTGEIIVGTLHMVGGSVLQMKLNPYSYLKIQQVALVGGGPHF